MVSDSQPLLGDDLEGRVGDLGFRAFATPHDANESLAFRFEDARAACAIATDLGLAGGTIAHVFRNELPSVAVTGVELDPDVIVEDNVVAFPAVPASGRPFASTIAPRCQRNMPAFQATPGVPTSSAARSRASL